MTDSHENGPVQRLDKWLWFSRVLKSRTLAAQLIAEGGVRVNRMRITKPSHSVRAGDVLTIAVRGRVLVLRILAAGERRGPATEARLLYEVLNGPTGHGAATDQGRDGDLESAAKGRG